MDGVQALRTVFGAADELTALVPGDRISADPVPIGAPLPAIVLASISAVDLNLPNPGTRRFVRERVRATALAESYDGLKAILRAMRHAAADQVGVTVPGLTAVSIHTDGKGPEAMDPETKVRSVSQDFMIKFSEER